MTAGRYLNSGPKRQINVNPVTIHSTATASLFLARRCQASRQSEVPCSASSGTVGAKVAGRVSRGISVEFQFGVEPNLGDVHEQVEQDDQHGVKQDCAQHQSVVAVE